MTFKRIYEKEEVVPAEFQYLEDLINRAEGREDYHAASVYHTILSCALAELRKEKKGGVSK